MPFILGRMTKTQHKGFWTLLRKNLHASPNHNIRFQNSRFRGGGGVQGGSPSRVLLDKFVKHLSPDGALVVEAPFSLQLRGSYFDEKNNVNRNMNNRMTKHYIEQHNESECSLRDPCHPKNDVPKKTKEGELVRLAVIVWSLLQDGISNSHC